MTRILVATTNLAKFVEVARAFEESAIEIIGLRDMPHVTQVAETGETFEENAILKAKGYFAQSGIPCIADDGGLVVDALGGLPGVHSHRWLGHEATDEELASAVIERMRDVPVSKRTARLGGYIIFWDGVRMLKSEHWLEGVIAESVTVPIQKGFPYRSILFIPEIGKLYADLTEAEHEHVNFRRKNLRALRPEIEQLINAL